MIRILLLDNKDSFTYNLAELLRKNSKVTFNISTAEMFSHLRIHDFDKIIFSPGPGIPEEHPVIFEILQSYGKSKSIFGVCLGCQAIAIYFGAELYNLANVRHGEVTAIHVIEPSHKLFRGLPGKFNAGLYHSWAVDTKNLSLCLQVTAISEEGIIMGLAHRSLDICGVQFHPESIMTEHGQRMIDNWIRF